MTNYCLKVFRPRLIFPGWAWPTLIFSRVGGCPPCPPRAGAHDSDHHVSTSCSAILAPLLDKYENSVFTDYSSCMYFVSDESNACLSRSCRFLSFPLLDELILTCIMLPCIYLMSACSSQLYSVLELLQTSSADVSFCDVSLLWSHTVFRATIILYTCRFSLLVLC